MRIRDLNDFVVGLLFVALALLVFVIALGYPAGTAGNMGTGYLPRALAILLLLIAFAIIGRSLVLDGEGMERWPVRALTAIIAGVFLFAAIVEVAGVVISTLLLVCLGRLGSPGRPKLFETLLLGVFLGLATAGLFVGALGIPLPIWPELHG